MYNYELVDQFPTCLGLSVAQKGLGDVGGNKPDRCLWQMQGERLSVSCAELRTAVSKARRANRGQETMGFATPHGLLPLRALAGTAEKQKLEAEASESQLDHLGVCTNSI